MPRILQAALPIHAATHLAGGADPVAMMGELISDTLLGAGAASIDLTAIPATFKHLLLAYSLRGSNATQNVDFLQLRFNNDSAANYVSEELDDGQTATTRTEVLLGTGMKLNLFTTVGAGPTPVRTGVGELLIPDYASTTFQKSAAAYGFLSQLNTTTGQEPQASGGSWASTAAINRITLAPLVGGTLLAGSRVTLWGLR